MCVKLKLAAYPGMQILYRVFVGCTTEAAASFRSSSQNLLLRRFENHLLGSSSSNLLRSQLTAPVVIAPSNLITSVRCTACSHVGNDLQQIGQLRIEGDDLANLMGCACTCKRRSDRGARTELRDRVALPARQMPFASMPSSQRHSSCRRHMMATGAMQQDDTAVSSWTTQVSALSYGSWVSFSNQLDTKAAKALMGQCKDAGVNFFDNAEVGHNMRVAPLPLAT